MNNEENPPQKSAYASLRNAIADIIEQRCEEEKSCDPNFWARIHPRAPYGFPPHIIDAEVRCHAIGSIMSQLNVFLDEAVEHEKQLKKLHREFVCDDLGHDWVMRQDIELNPALRRHFCRRCMLESDRSFPPSY